MAIPSTLRPSAFERTSSGSLSRARPGPLRHDSVHAGGQRRVDEIARALGAQLVIDRVIARTKVGELIDDRIGPFVANDGEQPFAIEDVHDDWPGSK